MPRPAWRPIPGYEGRYEVSDSGQVRSLEREVRGRWDKPYRIPERVLKQSQNTMGRWQVSLCDGKRAATKQVHLLVLTAFVGPRPEGMEGCHTNTNHLDNRLSNLRWDTKSENALDQVRAGKHHESVKTHCPRNHPYSEENTRVCRGKRYCRACARLADRKRRNQEVVVR